MISQQEYLLRRQQCMQKIGAEGLAILSAAPWQVRNGEQTFPYRQDSHFYYLTGFQEPQAILLLVPGREEGESILFCQKRDPEREQWDGPRLGPQGAVELLRMDQAFSIDQFEEQLQKFLPGRRCVYYSWGCAAVATPLIAKVNSLRGLARRGVVVPELLAPVETIVQEMRQVKSSAEINLMRTASEISARGHCRAMRACRPGMMEYELEAELLYEFIRGGCRAVAYTPIVGSGPNTCVLHYSANNRRMQDGELVLVDAGGEYDNYASDITRTYPVNGRFSAEQKAIYEIVLRSQEAVIAAIKPGVQYDQLQQLSERVVTEGLCDLGLLQGKVDDLLETRAFRKFYMHTIGHMLGLDCHDHGSGSYANKEGWLAFVPNLVITSEPGIYISANMPGIDPRWWNIGVRIEDDVLVTATGHEVLSCAVPKHVVEIEALMAE